MADRGLQVLPRLIHLTHPLQKGLLYAIAQDRLMPPKERQPPNNMSPPTTVQIAPNVVGQVSVVCGDSFKTV